MYDNFSQDYDRFVNWKNRLAFEMSFIVDRIHKSIPKQDNEIRVLDTATGTGLHAIALAGKGFMAAGSDISAGMIEKARSNAREQKQKVYFTTTGFGQNASAFHDQSSLFPFDVLLCLGNSLPHVENRQELTTTLHDFYSCLSPNGLLLIQSRNFDSILQKKERWMEPQFHLEGDREWLFLRFYDFLSDGHIQFNILTLKKEPGSDWTQSIMETRLFPLPVEVMEDSLSESGFVDMEFFGSLSGEPFNKETSQNLVITARKK